MGRKSIKKNKSHFQLCREKCDYTRAEAIDHMQTVSEDRLEKIESGKTRAYPEDVVELAEAYRQPELCNWYCRNMCGIGSRIAPDIDAKELPQTVLEIINKLNLLTEKKDILITLAEDGKITAAERKEFSEIYDQLDHLSDSVESLKIWVRKTLAGGKITDDPFSE